ncbi:MAG UNVERIFIED_CONTAM: type VI secretion system baseplate subunit TssK [Planctomycetaceae bacterium]
MAAPGSAQNATQTPLRFVSHQEEREDENAAGNPQPVDFRRLNPRILFSAPEESLRGYDAVPLFQLRLGSTPEAPPRIDTEYIPPILRLEASAEATRIIRSVYDRLGAISGDLAAKILDRGVSLSTGHRDDFEIILRLHAVNSALGGLAPLPFLPNVHPLSAFTELARAAGLLAVFRPERRLAQLPPTSTTTSHSASENSASCSISPKSPKPPTNAVNSAGRDSCSLSASTRNGSKPAGTSSSVSNPASPPPASSKSSPKENC